VIGEATCQPFLFVVRRLIPPYRHKALGHIGSINGPLIDLETLGIFPEPRLSAHQSKTKLCLGASVCFALGAGSAGVCQRTPKRFRYVSSIEDALLDLEAIGVISESWLGAKEGETLLRIFAARIDAEMHLGVAALLVAVGVP